MKRKICGALLGILVFLFFGIIGGVEFSGQPFLNVLWCLPIMLGMVLLIKVGGLYE